jgi:hypothetical protein
MCFGTPLLRYPVAVPQKLTRWNTNIAVTAAPPLKIMSTGQSEADSELSHEEINNGDYTVRGIWTCLHTPDLPEGDEHVMDEDEVDTLDELADTFGVHNHTDCLSCEAHNNHYEGDLDRVEVIDSNGDVVQVISPEVLVQEYDMADDYGKYPA